MNYYGIKLHNEYNIKIIVNNPPQTQGKQYITTDKLQISKHNDNKLIITHVLRETPKQKN